MGQMRSSHGRAKVLAVQLKCFFGGELSRLGECRCHNHLERSRLSSQRVDPRAQRPAADFSDYILELAFVHPNAAAFLQAGSVCRAIDSYRWD